VSALHHLPLAVHLHRHLHLHGSPVGYAGIAVAAFASWAGLPGPGETVVITAAAFASRHRLDIVQVEFFAVIGAFAGGVVGWAVGRRFGAQLATRPGRLYRLRLRGVRTGQRFFERFGALAVLLTPSWVAGIHGLSAPKFLTANLVASVAWAAVYGLTTYFAGPHVADVFGDAGTYATIAIAAVAVAAAGFAVWRRRRRKQAS
jgi:membrane protein DedA with SNARE-associated domain